MENKTGMRNLEHRLLEPVAREPFPFRLLHAGWGIADSAPCRFENRDYGFLTVEYIVSGRGVLESDGTRFECGPDSVYFLHRHSNHCYWTLPDALWRKLFFILDGPLADTLTESYGLTREHMVPNVPHLKHCFEALMALGYGGGERSDRKAAVIYHQFAEACADTLAERAVTARPEVMALKAELDRNVDGKFRLETFCRNAGFSETHMIRRFREEFGSSPYEYLMRQRIEAARRLLDYSRKSVKEIAATLGFSDQYYFSGCFKARTGMSPSQYRRRS